MPTFLIILDILGMAKASDTAFHHNSPQTPLSGPFVTNGGAGMGFPYPAIKTDEVKSGRNSLIIFQLKRCLQVSCGHKSDHTFGQALILS